MSKKSRKGATSNPAWYGKGQSGNLGGRPKSRAPRSSAFDIVVEKTIVVTYHGIAREISAEEALQQRTYQDAMAGKGMAIRTVLKWMEKRDAWLEKHAPQATVPAAVTSRISPDPDNADSALLLLGIAAANPKRAGAEYEGKRMSLLLEPWAVQAALRRRRGGQRLTHHERDEIRRCTRDGDALRWPRGTGE
jgi:uncharacterized protein DUF5681